MPQPQGFLRFSKSLRKGKPSYAAGFLERESEEPLASGGSRRKLSDYKTIELRSDICDLTVLQPMLNFVESIVESSRK